MAKGKKVKKRKQKKEKKNYLSQSFDTYVSSFKSIKWDLLLMAVYDLLFFYIVFAIGSEIVARLMDGVMTLSVLKPPQGIDIATMTLHAQVIKSVYFGSIQDIIIAIVLAIFIYSIFKSLIWARVTERKLSWDYLSGFFITSIIWFAAWTLICLGSYFLFTAKAILVIYLVVTILLLHLTPILNFQLAKTGKKVMSVKKAFRLGFARVHYFLVPYVLMFATFLVVYVVLGYIMKAIRIGPEAAMAIGMIYFMLYFSWHRMYLAKVIRRIR